MKQHTQIIFTLLLFVVTVKATAALSRPSLVEFALFGRTDSVAGRYMSAEQLSGVRTALYVAQSMMPDVEVRLRFEPSPARILPTATRQAAVEAVVQSGRYHGFVLSDWSVTAFLVNATRAASIPVIAPHRLDSGASTPADRHVLHIMQGAHRETRSMVDHALHTSGVRAVRFVLFLRAVAGWHDVVDSVAAHLASVGLEPPAYFVFDINEPLNATAAVARWVNLSADFSRRPTAALLYMYAADVSNLMCAASLEPGLDWSTLSFYSSSLELPDTALTLSWNRSATLANSAEVRAIFSRLHLMDSLSDYHRTEDEVVQYFLASRAQFFASPNSSLPASEGVGAAYDTKPSRLSFAGFASGLAMMKLMATTLQMSSPSALVDRFYDAGELFLGRTAVGPFHNFCTNTSSSTDSDGNVCFCNSATHRHHRQPVRHRVVIRRHEQHRQVPRRDVREHRRRVRPLAPEVRVRQHLHCEVTSREGLCA